jgi:hypothetical protein
MSNDAKPDGMLRSPGVSFRRPSGGGEAIGSDDTEGQMLTDPGANRLVAGAREHQIRQQLTRHGLAEEARRPHRKEK